MADQQSLVVDLDPKTIAELRAAFHGMNKSADYAVKALSDLAEWDWDQLGRDLTELHRILVLQELKEEFGE